MPNGEASLLSRRLLGVPGVTEAVVLSDDGVAYLKVERDRLDRDMLNAVSREIAPVSMPRPSGE